MGEFDLARVLKFLPGIIIGLTVHEFSHAVIAHKCGDLTAKQQGRVSLNPLRHIDLLGFVMLLVAGFGWAKPVEFNEQNLRNPRRDIIKIALAGPLSNALTAMLFSIVYVVLFHFIPVYHSAGTRIVDEVMLYLIYINWGLFVFNLIPFPPLDGSHLLLSYFRRFPVLYEALYKYGSWLFFGIILLMIFTKVNLLPIWPAINFFGDGFLKLVNGVLG